MKIHTIEPDVFQCTYLSAILPGECFRLENSDKVYIMTNFDEVDERYIAVNLSTGLRIDFTTSEAEAMWVTRMHVDATAKPYEVEPPKSLSEAESKELLESLRRILRPLFFDTTTQSHEIKE